MDAQPSKRPSRRAVIAISVVALLLVAAGAAYAIGSSTADDSDEVASLSARLEQMTAERGLERDRADTSEQEAEVLRERSMILRDRIQTLRGRLSESGVEPTAAAQPASGRLRVGETGQVAHLALTLDAFTQQPAGGENATWVAEVSARNDGSDDLTPFCGDGAGEMYDRQGRAFDAESVIDDDTDNCTDLQPGLTGRYRITFAAPTDAEPVSIRLWGDYDFASAAAVWAAP